MLARLQGGGFALRKPAPRCAAARCPPRCLACLAPLLRATTIPSTSSDVLTTLFLPIVVPIWVFAQRRVHAPGPQKKYLDFYGNQVELQSKDNPRQVMQLLKAKLSSPATPWNAISGRENVSLSERRLQQLHVEYRSSRVAQEAVRAKYD